jgi:transposase
MLGGTDVIEIVRLHEVEGLGVRAIAKRLGLSRNTVRKYLREPAVPEYGPQRPA